MKKATSKILMAVMALVVAIGIATGTTFAWFTMNTTVTANGMAVSAKTDNAYLIIKEGTTLSGNATIATASLDVALRPVKPVTTLTSSNIETLGSWGTAASTDPNDANSSAEVTALTSGTLLGDGNYVGKQSFMVGIVENSGTVAHDLRLDTLTISDTTDGITVVVVCGNNVYTHNANVSTGNSEVLATAANVTAAGVQVNVYIYIDGSNAAVKTANAANLGGSVSMTFSIDAIA